MGMSNLTDFKVIINRTPIPVSYIPSNLHMDIIIESTIDYLEKKEHSYSFKKLNSPVLLNGNGFG